MEYEVVRGGSGKWTLSIGWRGQEGRLANGHVPKNVPNIEAGPIILSQLKRLAQNPSYRMGNPHIPAKGQASGVRGGTIIRIEIPDELLNELKTLRANRPY